MKSVRNQILFTILAVMCCAAVFLGISFLMLSNTSKPVRQNESAIPYTESQDATPKGLLFNFLEGESVFINFDTEQNTTMIILLPHNCNETSVSEYGYVVFKRIKSDYTMLEGFIDRIGGIEFNNIRYTGVQITDELKHNADKQLRRDIISAIFEKIADKGLTSENLVFIIENSDTDFSFPDGYSLLMNIETLSRNVNFVN